MCTNLILDSKKASVLANAVVHSDCTVYVCSALLPVFSQDTVNVEEVSGGKKTLNIQSLLLTKINIHKL